jgi:hypothetical protein
MLCITEGAGRDKIMVIYSVTVYTISSMLEIETYGVLPYRTSTIGELH